VKVLVDSSVWSLALRRPLRTRIGPAPEVVELQRLIGNFRVAIIGSIRQEILSGIREASKFERIRSELAAFVDFSLTREHYELAASLYHQCRAKGVQGSNTDFLICAASISESMSVFSTDKDFAQFAKVLPIKLHAAAVH